ncbi:hypothetical protein BH11MYX3_BH11MYX3_41880 [soil metagenome]
MRNRGLELEEIDYAKGLTAYTFLALVAKAGSVAAVLNTRNAAVKDKGWVAKPPSPAEFAKAVVKDVNLLRRPILIDGDTMIIGFDRARYEAL